MREMVLMILASRRQAIQLRGLCQNNIINVKRFISIVINEKGHPRTRMAWKASEKIDSPYYRCWRSFASSSDGVVTAELVREFALGSHLLLDIVDVIEVVGEGRVDVGKSDRRNIGDDLVGSHALMLMPHDDIDHTDTVAGDAGLAAANAGRPGDPILGGRRHDSSIKRTVSPLGLTILAFATMLETLDSRAGFG